MGSIYAYRNPLPCGTVYYMLVLGKLSHYTPRWLKDGIGTQPCMQVMHYGYLHRCCIMCVIYYCWRCHRQHISSYADIGFFSRGTAARVFIAIGFAHLLAQVAFALAGVLGVLAILAEVFGNVALVHLKQSQHHILPHTLNGDAHHQQCYREPVYKTYALFHQLLLAAAKLIRRMLKDGYMLLLDFFSALWVN